tara:strand:+ start:313 stop:522 length:210 start_codon:yes stop_codon:yes gene_type:complete
MSKAAEVIHFISKEKIICTERDWKNMDREEAVRKECAARKKQIGLDPIAHRNIWNHIKQITWEEKKGDK